MDIVTDQKVINITESNLTKYVKVENAKGPEIGYHQSWAPLIFSIIH